MSRAFDICTYGHPALRTQAKAITLPDATAGKLAEDMLTVMANRRGVGLAAPQIGLSWRIFVINFDLKMDCTKPDGPRLNPDVKLPLVLINPEITKKRGRQTDTEGCLSVPEIWAPVTRAMEIEVNYFDVNGVNHQLVARGFLARVIQHELDHLNGVLFIDRLSPIRKLSLIGNLKQLQQRTEAALRGQSRSKCE